MSLAGVEIPTVERRGGDPRGLRIVCDQRSGGKSREVIMPGRRRLGFLVIDSAITSLLLVLVVSCTTAPRLPPTVAADRIRRDIDTGMTKFQVRRVVGEPERREPTSLLWGDVAWQTVAGSNKSGECWLWGVDRLKPDAFVCFSGLDRTVSHKSP